MMMFRSVADVVQKTDLRGLLTLPRIRTGQRQLITAAASPAFKDYQRHLAERIEAIKSRKGRVQKGDDILLSVITDGRHAAIDMRLVWHGSDDEPANKLNKLIDTVHRIWRETAEQRYRRPDGTDYPIPGAGQMIFSDLGTINVEATRGFSAYRWIKQQLIARGVPASQIAFMQDYKRSADKQRLFADFRAGRVRILIGSSDTMGTGVNVQQRLKALHHLDVPWLPSQIEQREGRIERQGNQHDEIDIFAYATLGSMDATMWQNNERKARFIEAALSGDRTIRRIEDAGSQANQFAMAKAIASGDSRLMRKAGLESEIARLQRQRAAHVDDQHAVRRQIRDARLDQAQAEGRIRAITPGPGPAAIDPRRRSSAMEVEGRTITQRKAAGASLLTKIAAGRAGTRRTPLDGRPHRRLRPDLRRPRRTAGRAAGAAPRAGTDGFPAIDRPRRRDDDGRDHRPAGACPRPDGRRPRRAAPPRRRRESAAGRLRAAPRRGVPIAGRAGRQARPACRDRGGPRQHRGRRQREAPGAAEGHRRLNGVSLSAAPAPLVRGRRGRERSFVSESFAPGFGRNRRAGPPQPRARFRAASRSAKGDPSWAGSTATNRSTIPSLISPTDSITKTNTALTGCSTPRASPAPSIWRSNAPTKRPANPSCWP